MHEHALIDRVIETILERPEVREASSVKEIFLKVGTLDMHSEDSFRQVFEIQAAETPLKGAALHLRVVPGRLDCQGCGFKGDVPPGQADGHDPVPYAQCPECQAACAVLGGRGVEGIELSLE